MNYEYPLKVYKTTVETVPAYRKFLEEHCGAIPSVENIEDFYRLPFIDKPSYIQSYPLNERCTGGTLKGKHIISHSSGTSGKYQYWPTLPELEKNYWKNLYKSLDDNFKISEKSTLVILGLLMGGNLSGSLFAYALRAIGIETGCITLMTPGHNEEACIEDIIQFSQHFEQTILFSYPATAKNIIERAAAKFSNIRNLNIKIRLVGDGYSEAYRDNINNLLGYPYGYMESVSSGYGATDFRTIGRESLLCTAIKRLLFENSKVSDVLEMDTIPTICQINTNSVFIEEYDSELIMTQYNAVPLVRYRSNDAGKIISFDEMLNRLKDVSLDPVKRLEESGFDTSKLVQDPFVILTGRRDGSIVFKGAKLPVQKIKLILETVPYLSERLTGEFQMRITEDNSLNTFLELLVVPRPEVESLNAEDIANHFLDALAAIQGGIFSDLVKNDRAATLPKVRFVQRGHIMTSSGFKIKYTN